MKQLVQLKNKENENLDPINLSYEKRISNLEGTVLYDNSTGTTESFNLSDSIANYDCYEIIFKNVLGYMSSIKSQEITTSLVIHYIIDHNYACTGCKCTILGTQVILDSFFLAVNGAITDEINKYISIVKIIGYK